MEVIIAFREERGSLQMHLHHQQEPVDEEEEEEDSYYATAVREEEEEYFEATGRSQHQQQDRACDTSSGVEEICHQSEEQLKEFSDYFLRKTKEIIDKKANEVRRRRK